MEKEGVWKSIKSGGVQIKEFTNMDFEKFKYVSIVGEKNGKFLVKNSRIIATDNIRLRVDDYSSSLIRKDKVETLKQFANVNK